jgi:exodeoxyribonuclease VII large subunit
VVRPTPSPLRASSADAEPQLGFAFEAAPAPIARHIWTVGELVGEVRQHIEREYSDLWVEGEISNLRAAPSGHVYFTLKDGEAQLPAVLFRRQASLLRFKPADGLHVLLRGKISVYEQRGQMQLVAEFLEPVGAGSLQIAFEQLKARLEARGLFDAARKKALPLFPRCVGIVTSPTGAVIRDFLNIMRRRHAGLHVLLYPALVQGETAAAEVAGGITYFNRTREVDVIVLARGGGSLEDLAPFNSEPLAEAIAASEVPIVSAIGHETDFTIADFVADLRAPTPSAAAELVTAALHNVAERVQDLDHRLVRGARYRLMQAANAVARVRVEGVLMRGMDQLRRRQQRIDDLSGRLEAQFRTRCRAASDRLGGLVKRLAAHDVAGRAGIARERLTALDARMARAAHGYLRGRGERRAGLERQLSALSPVAVLSRGYALVYDEAGALIKTTEDVREGEAIVARLARGRIRSRVTHVEKEDRDS